MRLRRIPSRRMPSYQQPISQANLLLGAGCGLTLTGMAVGSAIAAPWETLILASALLVLFAVALLFALAMNWLDRARQKRLAEQRQNESICTFARSFDCRQTDPWIIRAVYEEIQADVIFPIRHTDRFEEELGIDREDVEPYVERIAQRTARRLAGMEHNCWYYRVDSIETLVMFLQEQPRTLTA